MKSEGLWRSALIAVALLGSASFAQSGALVAWGEGLGINVPHEVEAGIAVAAGQDYGLVLLPNRTLVKWGIATLNPPPEATNIISVAAGYRHVVAARGDGSCIVWGQHLEGNTLVPPEATNAVAVAAGESLSAALRADGTVVCWGKYFDASVGAFVPLVLDPDLTNVVQISIKFGHLMCLLSDGTVRCYGNNAADALRPPDGLKNVKAIAAGKDLCLALKTDGTVVSWGTTLDASITGWKGVKAIGAGYDQILAVMADGSVDSRGKIGVTYQKPPTSLQGVMAVAGGLKFSVALLAPCMPPVLAPPQASPGTRVCSGTAVALSQVAVEGTTPYSYQWVRNGEVIEGATDVSYVITQPQNGDQYACIVASSCGATNLSEAVTLTTIPPPSAPNLVIARPAGISAKMTVVSAEDAAHGYEVTAVGSSSTGAIITFGGSRIFYECTSTNAIDSFTYTVGSGSCAATGTITVTAVSAGGVAQLIEPTANGVRLRFAAIPGLTYEIQRSDDPLFETYTQVWTVETPEDGIIEFTDDTLQRGQAYYRLMR